LAPSGRRTLVRVRAAAAGEVVEVDRADLLTFVQTDSELSDIIMRAFILRRVEMIAQGVGDVILTGPPTALARSVSASS
jgi:thioredoxin reductase (NADPH)